MASLVASADRAPPARRLTGARVAWLAAGAVLAGAYLSGVLPEPPDAQEAVGTLGDGLGDWTYAVVGGLAFLETAALVGLLAPGEWSAIVGGAVAGEGVIEVAPLVAIVWACAAAGHSAGFLAGRRLGRTFLVRHGPRLRIGPERLARVDEFFVRHGAKAVLGGQFVAVGRAVVPFLAGASGMAYRRFLPASLATTAAWAAAFTLLGFYSYRSLAQVEGAAAVAGTAIAVVAAAGGLLVVRRRARETPRTVALRDGTSVEVRPIAASDRAELAAGFARLSAESRRRRFGGPKPRLSDRELTYLTEVDHHGHEALVAVDPVSGRGIAVARYAVFADDPTTADVAVTVDDAWQRRGLGRALAQRLIDRAAAEGVERLRATVSGDNGPALGLARRLGYDVASVESGYVELERDVAGRL